MIRTFCNGWSGEVAGQLRKLWGEQSLRPLTEIENHPGEKKRVLHMAARLTQASGDELIAANISLLKDVVELCVKNQVEELVFFSTNSIYDHQDEENLPERNLMLEPSLYTLSKYWGEQYLQMSALPRVLCLRFPGFLEVKKATNFMAKTAQKIASGENIEINNGQRRFNSFMAVADLADFLKQVNLHKKFDVINLAAPAEKTLLEILQIIKDESGSPSQLRDRGLSSPFISTSIAKAQNEYGYRPGSVEQSLRQWVRAR